MGGSNEKVNIHFSSKRFDWTTPGVIYGELDAEFKFVFDPCPTNPQFGVDGLKIPWKSPAFLNPPYGRYIGEWIQKAFRESLVGITSVCLIPSRTDTAWWHDYVMKADEIRFIRGRLKFGNAKNNAPFPSCIVVFRGK